MKNLRQLTLTMIGCTLSVWCLGQTRFNTCAAAFLDNKMVVDAYTDKGKCLLPSTATGQLTVCTVELSPTASKAVDKTTFKVAIRDKATKTLHLYSNEAFKQIEVRDVLTKCRKGDHIVLLTVDDLYSLPHNEILVQ